MRAVVSKMRKIENKLPNTNALRRLSLNEKRSSKVSSFNTTKRYLNVSFSFILLFDFDFGLSIQKILGKANIVFF